VSSLTLRLGADAPSAGDQWTPLERGIASAREVAWGRPAWFEIDERDDADSRDDVQASDPEPETPEELTIMSRRVRRSGHESIDGHTVLRSPKRVANWILRFASGQVIGVAGRVVVGRAPRPTEGTPPGVEQVEQLLSLRREVSANHALLIPEEDGVRVVDLHSTNGTVVRPRDGSSVLLTNGADALLEAGDRVNFGDDNIAVCERLSLCMAQPPPQAAITMIAMTIHPMAAEPPDDEGDEPDRFAMLRSISIAALAARAPGWDGS